MSVIAIVEKSNSMKIELMPNAMQIAGEIGFASKEQLADAIQKYVQRSPNGK